MPSKQDILTAIKNLDHFLKIPQLKGATARINKNGKPFAYTGGFNMVFQLLHNSKKWAFRVWHVPMGENKERFLKIASYLSTKKLPYLADFIYDENGIVVNSEPIDTIRMEWLEGFLLKEYIEYHLQDPKIITELADNFFKMCKELKENNISHGDLQEGNILIDKNGAIKLVDYDSVCVPEIEGQKEIVTGLKGYQHPSRFQTKGYASLKSDYFSELIIYISILAFAKKPDLWIKYKVKETQYLLFTEGDFEDIQNSTIYNDLKGLSSKIDMLLKVLLTYLNTSHYTLLNPINYYINPPRINYFKSNTYQVIKGQEILLSWKVDNSIKVTINNGINEVNQAGSVSIIPKENIEYIITAEGFEKTIHEKLFIYVFPSPIIESIQVPLPVLKKQVNINIKNPKFPDINLGIVDLSTKIIVNSNKNLPQTINKIKFQKLNSKAELNMKRKGLRNIYQIIKKLKFKQKMQ